MNLNHLLTTWKPSVTYLEGFWMMNINWGLKLAWVPRVSLTSGMAENHLLTTLKPPATSLEGFWIMNITWEAKKALIPRDRQTPKMPGYHNLENLGYDL